MNAPEKFAIWMTSEKPEVEWGKKYRYHSRSDLHSIVLCKLIVDDLIASSELMQRHAISGTLVYGINLKHKWGSTGKHKTLDLALGVPAVPIMPTSAIARVQAMSEVRIACEAKTVMTEHGKSQPRIYDELSSSHEIVHQGDQAAIACGIVVVNVADRFASPLRQVGKSEMHFSLHKQPFAAQKMVTHLRGLPIRDQQGQVGFDAFASVVVDCDNVGACSLRDTSPAPQVGDKDHYSTFINRIAAAYIQRYGV